MPPLPTYNPRKTAHWGTPRIPPKAAPLVYTYFGIDPGESGGIVAIHIQRDNPNTPASRKIETTAMPATERDIWDWIRTQSHGADGRPNQAFAAIEKVGGFIQGNPTPGSAMFRFGANYGALLMALTGNNVAFEEVRPQSWQKALGISSRKGAESKTSFKNRIKKRAQQLYPSLHVTLYVADALLIAEYCRRTYRGIAEAGEDDAAASA